MRVGKFPRAPKMSSRGVGMGEPVFDKIDPFMFEMDSLRHEKDPLILGMASHVLTVCHWVLLLSAHGPGALKHNIFVLFYFVMKTGPSRTTVNQIQ